MENGACTRFSILTHTFTCGVSYIDKLIIDYFLGQRTNRLVIHEKHYSFWCNGAVKGKLTNVEVNLRTIHKTIHNHMGSR